MMVERLAGLNGCEGIELCTAGFLFINLSSADFSKQAQTSHARVMREIQARELAQTSHAQDPTTQLMRDILNTTN